MATVCRRKRSRRDIIKLEARLILIGLVALGMLIGFFIGKAQTKTVTETVTVTEIVEVPAYDADNLPEVSDIYYFDIPLSNSLQRFIYEVCADNEVPVTLVLALIEHESRFNPEAVSSTGDYGLMQINEVNHKNLEERFRTADMLDPYQNIFCGVKILSEYIKKYEGNYSKALMAYNMGSYGAEKAWKNEIKSTKFSDSILTLFEKYEEVVKNNGK